MQIGELARAAGCDPQTVRFYERERLLDEPHRAASGYRRYTPEDLQRLQFIRHCRSLDIPLPDIRDLLALAAAPERSCRQVDALLDTHIAAVQQRLRSLTALEAQLVGLRGQCDGSRPQACAILQTFLAAAQPPSRLTGRLPKSTRAARSRPPADPERGG